MRTWRCWLFGCRGWVEHKRDKFGVNWIGLRCVRCNSFRAATISAVQDLVE